MGSELVLDIQALIAIVLDPRHEVFALLKVHRPRTLLFDLREIRNTFAHQKEAGDTYTNRALDTVELLLEAVKAPQATATRKPTPGLPRRSPSAPVPAATSSRSPLDALRPDAQGRERGQRLFRYLAAQANKGRAVGISYDRFISFLHGKPRFFDVMNRNYAQCDTNRIIDIAHEITDSVGRIEVKRGATSIKAGMDTFIWQKKKPHDRSKGAWNHPKYTLPYSPEDWRRVFPDGLREMVKERELEKWWPEIERPVLRRRKRLPQIRVAPPRRAPSPPQTRRLLDAYRVRWPQRRAASRLPQPSRAVPRP
jgi:hypothetical protein